MPDGKSFFPLTPWELVPSPHPTPRGSLHSRLSESVCLSLLHGLGLGRGSVQGVGARVWEAYIYSCIT